MPVPACTASTRSTLLFAQAVNVKFGIVVAAFWPGAKIFAERAGPHLAASDIAGLDDSENDVCCRAWLEHNDPLLAAGERWLADLMASNGNGGNASY